MTKDVNRKNKSQKRVDRQARKKERDRLNESFKKFKEKKESQKPVKVRFSKKSLPSFLAKNSNVIL